jgi:aubergine-like protein
VNRKLFDISKLKRMDTLEIWPGYATAFHQNNNKNFLTIDLVHKVCTNKRVLDVMGDIRNKCSHDYEMKIKETIIGTSVMTVYNREIYRIDDVDFEKNPGFEFTNRKDGKPITFTNYYKEKYQVDIKVSNQPLLKHIDKRTQKEIFLIPELCVTTGLTDQQRANRRLMSSLDEIIKPNPEIRMRKCKDLIANFYQKEGTAKFMKDWDVNISKDPISVNGSLINPGNMLMGNKRSINIQRCNSLDRNVQTKMLKQINLNTIMVFYPRMMKKEFGKFASQFEACLNEFQISYNKLTAVEVPDFRRFDPIRDLCKQKLNSKISGCIFILPGRKNQGQHYDNLKKLLINHLPVPSQMILGSTISRGRNLRSIINKMLIQFKAKVGGTPWALDQMPFTKSPSMVIGVDVFGKIQGSGICVCALVSTVDRHFARYNTQTAFIENQDAFVKELAKMFKKSIENFAASNNKRLPDNIILYREGISQGMRNKTKETEIAAMLKVIEEIKKERSVESKQALSLIFVTVSKSNGTKFFGRGGRFNNGGLGNPQAGSYVYENVCKDVNEFFLVSQKPGKGLSSPSNYYILHNDVSDKKLIKPEEVRDMIATLSFKMCYLYFNTVGSIKIPAPIHYAHKLAAFVGEKSDKREKMIPHQHLSSIKSLFFI